MTKLGNRFYQIGLFVGDVVLFFVSLFFAYALRNQDLFPQVDYFLTLSFAFLPIAFFVVVAYFIATLYEVPSLLTTIARVKLLLQVHVVALLFGFSLFYIFPAYFGVTPKVVLLLQIVVFTIVQVCFRVVASHHIRTKKKRKALLIGQGDVFKEIKHAINDNPQSSFSFVEHLEVQSPLLTSGTIDSLREVLRENDISLIVLDVKNERIIPLLPYFYNLVGDGVRIYDINKMYEDIFRRLPLSSVGYFWFFENVSLDMKLYEAMKRVIDIVVALLVACVWLLLHPFVAFLIKREDGGPVFLSNQSRIGRHGKPIRLIKYRTMSQDDGGVWLKEKGNKNRVTKIGYYLRKSRIDELPQVINVLKGEISLVGPRPDIVDLGKRMADEIPFYMIRYSVTPGLSGWAQTLQEKPPQSVEETKERLMYDLFYIKNRSLLVDFVVLLRTIRTVLIRSGM
jgi:lipopolysaccharide/colanic/teichoic acid biosynthesis glycosyltransferase